MPLRKVHSKRRKRAQRTHKARLRAEIFEGFIGVASSSVREKLEQRGVEGFCVKAFNNEPYATVFRRCYTRAGWLGVSDALRYFSGKGLLKSVPVTLQLVWEIVRFQTWRWRVVVCTYKEHGQTTGGWWYIRQPRGQPPLGCPDHARAATQWRCAQKRRARARMLAARATRLARQRP